MKIIFLSGGSGKRLWPLSNDIRSKQFLQLFLSPTQNKESMVQRNVRQLRETGIDADIIFTTSQSQIDSIYSQFGNSVEVVTEPMRRDTFPAIALASVYLSVTKKVPFDEPIVVMPCDQFTEPKYYTVIKEMAEAVANNKADLVLMGITPTEPSTRYGYIVPNKSSEFLVSRFTEKPDADTAAVLVREGAVWNGGVFAFKLGWINKIVEKYIKANTFDEFRNQFENLPKISFDYEVVEKAKSIGVCRFSGLWKDLGTWDALTEQLPVEISGEGYVKDCKNVSIINELKIPVVCHGVNDIVVAVSYDGILVSSKERSSEIKNLISQFNVQPMFAEKSWGSYNVLNIDKFSDGHSAITKQMNINQGESIRVKSTQGELITWSILNGEGELLVKGHKKYIKTGDVIQINYLQCAVLRANSPIEIVEVRVIDN